MAVQRPTRGPQGQAAGTIASAPEEVDEIVRKVYGEIYKGNCKDKEAVVEKYMQDYDSFIFKMDEAEIEDVIGRDVKTTCNEAKHTAAGMDQWTPADLQEHSGLAYQRLAEFLNMVEKGAPCPEALNSARAAFLGKDPDDKLNPLAYRVLLMLPVPTALGRRSG